jgi:hypothetical protein
MDTSPKTRPTQPGTWDFFDAIYCISLDDRPDRRREARRQFAAVGLTDRVEFVRVTRHPADTEQGIWESHRECIAKGLSAGADHLLIFEDDIVFDGFRPQVLRDMVAFLRANDQCRLLFLGCLVRGSRRTDNPAVLKVDYRSLAHAYVVHRALAAELVNHKWRRVPFDVMLAGLKEEKFAVYPGFAFQSNALSDNANHRTLEKFRRLCGGLKFIQKMNETFYRHRTAIIGAHILVMAATVWLIW